MLGGDSSTVSTRRVCAIVTRVQADVVTDTSLPLAVGGYRVGRQLSQGRFLGHALAPSLVELVFLDVLPHEQKKIVCSAAQDFSSLPDGGRVAILARTPNNADAPEHGTPVNVRLTTPPDLVESWRHMEEATAAASIPPSPAPGETNSLIGRVTGLVKRARRGPLVLAVIAGVVAVIAVVALVPAAPSNTLSSGVSSGASSTEPSSELTVPSESLSNPFASGPVDSLDAPTQASSTTQFSTSTEPQTPLSSLGDFILVRVPARSGEGPGEIAVLERSADSWIVRETYPETSGAPQESPTVG